MEETNRYLKNGKKVIAQAKLLAKDYYELTGRPLGITGEVAEYETIRLLNLRVVPPRQSGHDATRLMPDGRAHRVQIKGRVALRGRVGSVKTSNEEWDSVCLVLLSNDFEPLEIFEADRAAITMALEAEGSIARNQRGSLSIHQFKSISVKVWPEM